jgi:hypothetical protein
VAQSTLSVPFLSDLRLSVLRLSGALVHPQNVPAIGAVAALVLARSLYLLFNFRLHKYSACALLQAQADVAHRVPPLACHERTMAFPSFKYKHTPGMQCPCGVYLVLHTLVVLPLQQRALRCPRQLQAAKAAAPFRRYARDIWLYNSLTAAVIRQIYKFLLQSE